MRGWAFGPHVPPPPLPGVGQAVAVAAAAATMVGGELGILCFFESLLQEQCRFLWVSPPPALRQPCCPVLPPSDPLLEKWGGDLGGSWPLECMALLGQHHLCPRA